MRFIIGLVALCLSGCATTAPQGTYEINWILHVVPKDQLRTTERVMVPLDRRVMVPVVVTHQDEIRTIYSGGPTHFVAETWANEDLDGLRWEWIEILTRAKGGIK